MRYKNLICFLCIGLPQLALAAGPAPLEPWNFTARYTVAWTGISIGRIYITATEDATGYHMTVDTKTHGVGALFSDEKRVAEVTGTRTDGHYLPTKFESRPQDKNKSDRTELTYDAQGKLTGRIREPDDDPNWRPPVPREQLGTATDPITAGFVVRKALPLSPTLGDKTSTHTYDGARLAQMTVHVENPRTTLTIMKQKMEALDVTVTRQPINGYTPKELKKFAAGDPVIHLYFTADNKRLPLRATVDAPIGQITATLDELK